MPVLARSKRLRAPASRVPPGLHSICLLYWYKSTDTDATLAATDQSIAAQRRHRVDNLLTGARFTCFTSTQVRILTPEELDKLLSQSRPGAFASTSTQVRILTPDELDNVLAGLRANSV